MTASDLAARNTGTANTRFSAAALLAAWVLSSAPASAGPPFQPDDPEPTETGHWEIYAPAADIEGRGGDFAGATGIELNYGAAPDLQLTVGVEAGYSHDASGWQWGAGDLAVSAKYRFYHDVAAGIQVAAFPGLTLPTATNGQGAGRVTALLPVWIQKDSGPWSVFGAGGYLGAAAIFAAALALVTLLWFRSSISKAVLFWAAFILTRPLGATVGDFLDKPLDHGGLAMSRPIATLVLLAAIGALIWLLPQRAGEHPSSKA